MKLDTNRLKLSIKEASKLFFIIVGICSLGAAIVILLSLMIGVSLLLTALVLLAVIFILLVYLEYQNSYEVNT